MKTDLQGASGTPKTGPVVVAIFAAFPVGFIKDGCTGRGGGQAATWLPQLAEAWKEFEELEIHWCVLDRSVRRRETVRHWNQGFHRIPDCGVSVGLLSGRWIQRRGYREALREIRPDVIHCFGTETLHGAALWEFGGPSILSMQGVVHAILRTGDLGTWQWKLFRYWESKVIAKATVVTAESDWGLDRVAEIVPGTTGRKIEYGVSPGYYDVDWSPDPEVPRILFVGSLNRVKGVDILLEMLRRHRNRTWQMVVVGDGYLEEGLRSLDDPLLEVTGVLTTPEVQEQMAKSWGMVLPSRSDTSPNVIKEARVIGLPIVVSPNGGQAEYLRSGEDGMLVESEDPEDWFTALDALCSDFGRCKAMGEARHDVFREHFRPEKTVRAFLELYQELASPRDCGNCNHQGAVETV